MTVLWGSEDRLPPRAQTPGQLDPKIRAPCHLPQDRETPRTLDRKLEPLAIEPFQACVEHVPIYIRIYIYVYIYIYMYVCVCVLGNTFDCNILEA